MPGELKLDFAPFALPAKGVLIVFCDEGLKFGSATQKLLKPTGDLITRAAAADRFKGKNGGTLDIVAPPGLDVSRLIVVGDWQGARSQVAGLRQARRCCHGQGSGGGNPCHDRC